MQFLGLTSLVLLGNEVLCSFNSFLKFLLVEPIYCFTSWYTARCYCSCVDDVFKLTLSLNWAVVFRYAVACGSQGDIRVQQSFVLSVDNVLDIRGTTIRNFDGFSVECFEVGVVGAKVLIDEFDEFGINFDLDGLAEWGGCSRCIFVFCFVCY